MKMKPVQLIVPFASAALLAAASAGAQPNANEQDRATTAQSNATMPDRNDTQGNVADAQKQVDEAARVVMQMKREPRIAQLLQQAKGVFIVPDYAKAAALVGGRGGGGVVLVKQDGKWSNPAFFNIGAASVGAQAGVAVGSMAMLLMSDKAVDMFQNQDNNFSLNANAGLTLVNYSAQAQGDYGKGDVVVWTDTEGAFAGASVGVSDINRDEEENRAYYGKNVSARQILTGKLTGQPSRAENLRDALSTRVAAK